MKRFLKQAVISKYNMPDIIRVIRRIPQVKITALVTYGTLEQQNLDPKTLSWIDWDGQKVTWRYCPFKAYIVGRNLGLFSVTKEKLSEHLMHPVDQVWIHPLLGTGKSFLHIV
jgi:hypothetical protein